MTVTDEGDDRDGNDEPKWEKSTNTYAYAQPHTYTHKHTISTTAMSLRWKTQLFSFTQLNMDRMFACLQAKRNKKSTHSLTHSHSHARYHLAKALSFGLASECVTCVSVEKTEWFVYFFVASTESVETFTHCTESYTIEIHFM